MVRWFFGPSLLLSYLIVKVSSASKVLIFVILGWGLDQMESGFLLDIVIREGSSVFELLSSENQLSLIRGNSLLVLDFCLDVFNGIGAPNPRVIVLLLEMWLSLSYLSTVLVQSIRAYTKSSWSAQVDLRQVTIRYLANLL